MHYYKIMGKKVECFKLSFDFFGVRIPIYFSGGNKSFKFTVTGIFLTYEVSFHQVNDIFTEFFLTFCNFFFFYFLYKY